jgi:hypothetical protein
MSQAQIPQAPSGEGKIPAEREFLVWKKDTWGSYGQHYNIYTFVLDTESKQQIPIFKILTVRHENNDSRKNIHRYTYVKQSELKKLAGKVLKIVEDYKSSGKHVITVKYKIVKDNGELEDLKYESGLRDASGFFDIVYLNDKKLIVRKDTVEIR